MMPTFWLLLSNNRVLIRRDSLASCSAKIRSFYSRRITFAKSSAPEFKADGSFDKIPVNPLILKLTGNRKDLKWDYITSLTGPVKCSAEKATAISLVKPGEFTSSFQLTADRLAEISSACVPVIMGAKSKDGRNTRTNEAGVIAGESSVDSSSGSKNEVAKMLLEQAFSMRKQLLVDKIVNDGGKIRKHSKNIRKAYDGGLSIAKLCIRYDLPPVAIFRDMLGFRVKNFIPFSKLGEKALKLLVKNGLRGEGEAWDRLMNDRDKQELADAKAVDDMTYAEDDNGERKISMEWEKTLYTYLDSQGIQYVTEKTLQKAGSKSTPDCVFLDDCYINGKLIRWIDMKCSYGTECSKYFMTTLAKQSAKYDQDFKGQGAFIYKFGYSELLPLKFPQTLFLDRGPLRGENPLKQYLF
jgi:hypothetical protein